MRITDLTPNTLSTSRENHLQNPKAGLWVVLFLLIGTLVNANDRALWVWSMGPKIVLEDNEFERADFFSFIAAPHGDANASITTIFMFFESNISEDLGGEDGQGWELLYADRVRDFVADAHSRGIQVHALFGDVHSALRHPHNQPAKRFLQAIFAYNSASASEEKLDGIHFDVEPYLLGENDPLSWETDSGEIWKQFLENLESWQSIVDEHNASTQDAILFGAAIPFWFEPSEESPMLDHRKIQDIVDYIAIMAYDTRKDTSGRFNVFNHIKNELEYARDPDGDGIFTDAKSKSVYCGIESIEVNWKEKFPSSFFKSLYPYSTSFFMKSNQELEILVSAILEEYQNKEDPARNFQSFAGTAMHYYEDKRNGEIAYRSLPSGNSNQAPACFVHFPSGKEVIDISKNMEIKYLAYDPNHDPLNITIFLSDDNGQSWKELPKTDSLGDSMEENDGVYHLNPSRFGVGNQFRVKVQATEVASGLLHASDISNDPFSLVQNLSDTTGPSSSNVTVLVDSKLKYPTRKFRIQWTPFPDDTGVRGYFYSLFGSAQPEKARFTRGLSASLCSENVGKVSVYVWAVDWSGNFSDAVHTIVELYSDLDGDGIADLEDEDRDGDGISNSTEEKEDSNPNDRLDFAASRVIGLYDFDQGTLENKVQSGSKLIPVSGNPAYKSFGEEQGKEKALCLEDQKDTPLKLTLEENALGNTVASLTLEMWIKPEKKSDLTFIPLFFLGDMDAGLALLLKNETDDLSLRIYDASLGKIGGFTSLRYQNDSLFDGDWHHLAMIYNGPSRSVSIRIDGVKVAERTGARIPEALTIISPLRLFDAQSRFDLDNNISCNFAEQTNCVVYENSAQFENNLFTHVDADIRYVGGVDTLKVTLAAIPKPRLGFYVDAHSTLDVDKDGLNDHWEKLYFGSIQAAKPGNDGDEDDLTNLEEFKAGSNPKDPDSPNPKQACALEESEWIVTIDVENAQTSQLILGQNRCASDGIDLELDEPSAPVFPGFAHISFQSMENDVAFVTDIREPMDYATWIVEAHALLGKGDMMLSWNTEEIPEQGLFLRELRDEDSSQTAPIMGYLNQFDFLTIVEGTTRHFALTFGHQSFDVELDSGWNLVSIPIDPRIKDPVELFPSAEIWAIWEWTEKGYHRPHELALGKGYWIYNNDEASTNKIIGDLPFWEEKLLLRTHWNLVGPFSRKDFEMIEYSQLISESSPIILPIYGWDGMDYFATSFLTSGAGYWVFGAN